MRLALLADVHANLQALDAVVDAAHAHAPDLWVVAGDVVGYHADAEACIARLRSLDARVVAGNHDRELGGDATNGTQSVARLALAHARATLSAGDRAWLDALPNRLVVDDRVLVVHGCFLNETHVSGYVTDTMLPRNLEAIASRDDWPSVGVCGHTHMPTCGWLLGAETVQPRAVGEVAIPRSARAALINPGAVGQPRDGDPRAAFALYDTERAEVRFERVAYDVEACARALVAAGLPATLGERLRSGR